MNKNYRLPNVPNAEELDHLYSLMTEKEKWRVTLCFCLGWSTQKIAEWSGCTRQSVCESITSAEKKAKLVNQHERLVDIIQLIFAK
jgi:predicted DNA-binding protein YlxM (UPF0122 family)